MKWLIIKYKIANFIVKMMNKWLGYCDPNSKNGHWQHVDNINIFSIDFLYSLEDSGTIQGFKHYIEVDTKACKLQKELGGFAIIEGDQITITNNINDIL